MAIASTTIQLNDRFSLVAEKIAQRTKTLADTITKLNQIAKNSVVALDKFAGSQSKVKQAMDVFNTASNKIAKLERNLQSLTNVKPVNLNDLVNGDISKQIGQIDKLKNTTRQVATRPIVASNNEGGVASNLSRAIIGGVVGGSIVSKTRDISEAKFNIQKLLPAGEDIKNYEKLARTLTAETGTTFESNLQQIANLIPIVKNGLPEVEQRIRDLGYATRIAGMEAFEASQNMASIEQTFGGSQADQTRRLVSGAKVAAILSTVTESDPFSLLARTPETLAKNTNLLKEQDAMLLAVAARARSSGLHISSVANGLLKLQQAFAPIAQQNKNVDVAGMTNFNKSTGSLLKQAFIYQKQLQALGDNQQAQQDFFEKILGGSKDTETRRVAESIFGFLGKMNIATVESFMPVQEAYKNGKISIQEYEKALSKLTDEERVYFAMQISNEEAIQIRNKRMAEGSKTFNAEITKLTESFGTLGTTLLNTTTPALQGINDGINAVLPSIINIIEKFPNATTAIISLASAFATLKVAALGLQAVGLTGLSSVLANLSKLVLPVALGIGAYKGTKAILEYSAEKKMDEKLEQSRLANANTSKIGYDTLIKREQMGQKLTPVELQAKERFKKQLEMQTFTQNTINNFTPISQNSFQNILQTQGQKGAVDVNINVKGDAKVETTTTDPSFIKVNPQQKTSSIGL